MDIFLSVIVFGLAVRTFLWHLQNWQLREYRQDRIAEYFSTQEGRKSFWNLWFFRGILPRPKISGRIILIIIITVGFIIIDYLFVNFMINFNPEGVIFDFCKWFVGLALPIKILIYERFLWLFVWVGILISSIPVNITKKRLYSQAREIVSLRNKNIKIIGITGSYGKSSTRKFLVHLLEKEFGENAVLTNPENHNTEVGIARLIIKSRDFFSAQSSKFFVAEMGAYKRGEIKTMCDFVLPEIGILTGIGNQHIALFGSQENIISGKFELAEAVTDTIFFNSDNKFLEKVFSEKQIMANSIGVSRVFAKNLQSSETQSEFMLYDKKFVLPWAGEFFVDNALLSLQVARKVGCNVDSLVQNLSTLAPLDTALHIYKVNDAVVIKDLYSQNENGVMAAIEYLSKFRGKLVFVGTPLLELANYAKPVHQKIFKKLKGIDAEVFWAKDEF